MPEPASKLTERLNSAADCWHRYTSLAALLREAADALEQAEKAFGRLRLARNVAEARSLANEALAVLGGQDGQETA